MFEKRQPKRIGRGYYSLQEIDFSWKHETQSKVESRVFLTFACGFLLDFLFPIVGCVWSVFGVGGRLVWLDVFF